MQDAKPAVEQISEYVRRSFQDRNGNIWFGTNDDGACRFDGKRFVYFAEKEGLAGKAVRGILQDEGGSPWFATDGGLSRYDCRAFTNFTVKDGLKANNAWSLLSDSRGYPLGRHGGGHQPPRWQDFYQLPDRMGRALQTSFRHDLVHCGG